MTWTVILSSKAVKDAKKLKSAGIKPQAVKLLALLEQDPFLTPPRYEKLVGNLSVFYSRRINIQNRLVYRVDLDRKVAHVLRMWTHYK